MSEKGEDKGERRASELLPPDGRAPVDPRDVVPAHASLSGEVETRKIGIRRVSGLSFGARIVERARWRPAGNSRAFWRNIEEDDPFLRTPARPTDAVLEIYPSQRLPRVEGSLPKPQPEVAKQYTPRPAEEAPPSRPRREVKRESKPKRPAPEARHTPEPRPAPRPQSKQEMRREVEPEPTPAPTPEPPRRLPPKPQNTASRSRTGRQRMPSRAKEAQGGRRKSAKEIREEKLAARSGKKEKVTSIDEYRDFMQKMDFLREKYEAGEELPEVMDETADKGVRRPKPRAEVKRGEEVPEAPAPAPAPEPEAPPAIDRRPPMPPKKEEPAVDRSIKPGGNSGGLDDLFGGGGDRVRIGRRARPKPGESTED